MLSADAGAALKNHTTATSRLCVSVGRFRIEGTASHATRRPPRRHLLALFGQETSRTVLEFRFDLLEDCYDDQ